MIITGFNFGHEIYCHPGRVQPGRIPNEHRTIWRYSDNNQPVKNSPKRNCPKCGNKETEDGHDPCIANLPGVKYACCGHGTGQKPYIMLNDDRIIRFNTLEELFKYFTDNKLNL